METIKRAFSSAALWIPLVTFTILAGLCFWYYDIALQRAELAVNQRVFQALGLFADQFRGKLDNYKDVAERAECASQMVVFDELQPVRKCPSKTSGNPGDFQITSSTAVAGNLLSFTYWKKSNESKTVDSNTSTVSESPEGKQTKNENTGSRDGKNASIEFNVPAAKLLKPFVDTFQWDIVKDIFLADTNGNVIYQSPRSNVTLTNLRHFYVSKPSSKSKPEESDSGRAIKQNNDSTACAPQPNGKGTGCVSPSAISQQFDLSEEFGFSRVTDVRLNGEAYKLYTVPVRVPVQSVDGSASGSENPSFLVGGIVPEKDFAAQAHLPLGNAVVGIAFILAIALLASYPLLKFRLINKFSLVHREQGFVFALQMAFTAALIGGAFGHIWFWSHPDNKDEELFALSAAVENNLVEEVKHALGHLLHIEQQKAVKQIAGYAQTTIAPLEKACGESAEPDLKVMKQIQDLEKSEFSTKAFPLKPRAHYDLVFWTDKNGYQILRDAPKAALTSTRELTPDVTRLCGWDSFKKVFPTVSEDEGQLWSFAPQLKVTPKLKTAFYIEGANSASVGRYLAHISRASTIPDSNHIVSATIAVPLASLDEPVLLPGFGFAILDDEGKVIFHSDSKKMEKKISSTPATAISN